MKQRPDRPRNATLPAVLRRLTIAAPIAACWFAFAGPAAAFPHVVKQGETLASIAERVYGRIEAEQLLVAENGLDAGGGVPIAPGMRLEIPALGHRRVEAGDTWPRLADELLGDARRSEVLAEANGSYPWLTPAEGQEIVVPFNLRVVAATNDSLLTIAYRFLGRREQAWMLDRYNHLKGRTIRRGDVVLVPLRDLSLTPEGKREAANAEARVRSEAEGRAREAQRKVTSEMPLLAAEIRNGRWVEAIARGNRMIGYGELAKPEVAEINKRLTEAYVALDAIGAAQGACAAWREADPSADLDPVELSPKIIAVCTSALAPAPEPTADPRPSPIRSGPTASAPPPSTPPARPRRERGAPR